MKNGLLLGACGNQSIRLRVSLVFKKSHAQEFIQLLEKTISKDPKRVTHNALDHHAASPTLLGDFD